MEIVSNKQRLRQELKRKRMALTPEQRLQESADICAAAASYMNQLRQQKQKSTLTLFTYLAYRDEPDTMPLLHQCWQAGDTVFAPRIDAAQDALFHLYPIIGIYDIEPGAFGIPEPKHDLPIVPESAWQEIDLILVPGLGYDKQGGRIGYGGGYYDRFMSRLDQTSSHLPVCGAFVFGTQITEKIPMESHDFRIDVLFMASEYKVTTKSEK